MELKKCYYLIFKIKYATIKTTTVKTMGARICIHRKITPWNY